MIIVRNEFVQRPGQLDLYITRGDDWLIELQLLTDAGLPFDLTLDTLTADIVGSDLTVIQALTKVDVDLSNGQVNWTLTRTLANALPTNSFWRMGWERASFFRTLISGNVEVMP